MTTKVSIKVESLHPGKKVQITSFNPETGLEYAGQSVSTEGTSVELYVHTGESLRVEEKDEVSV